MPHLLRCLIRRNGTLPGWVAEPANHDRMTSCEADVPTELRPRDADAPPRNLKGILADLVADPFGEAIPVRLSQRAADDDPHGIEGIDVASDRSPNGEEGALKDLVSGGVPAAAASATVFALIASPPCVDSQFASHGLLPLEAAAAPAAASAQPDACASRCPMPPQEQRGPSSEIGTWPSSSAVSSGPVSRCPPPAPQRRSQC